VASNDGALSSTLLTADNASEWVATLFEHVPTAATLRSCSGVLIWANEAYGALTGRPVGDMVGKRVGNMMPSDANVQAVFDDLGHSDLDMHHREFEYLRPDGTSVNTEATMHILRSAAGQVKHVFSFIHDVTARHELERRIELEDLVSSIARRFVDLDLDIHDDGVARALAELGEQFDADLVQLWDLERSDRTLMGLYHWSRHGGDALMSRQLDETQIRWLSAQTSEAPIVVSGAELASPDQARIVSMLGGRSITEVGSMVLVARQSSPNSRVGMVLLTSQPRRWTTDEVSALDSVLTLLAALRTRLEDRAYFSTAFDVSPMAVTIRDMNMSLIAANEAYGAMFGYSAEEIKNVRPGEGPRLVPEDLWHGADILEELRSTGRSHRDQLRYRSRTGEVIVGRFDGQVIKSPDGRPRYLLSYLEDITESKARDLALGRSKQRLHSIVENSPAITVLVDQDHVVTYVNSAVETIGYSVDQIVGRTLIDVGWDRVDRECAAVFADGAERRFEIEAHAPVGLGWWNVFAVPEFGTSGEISGVILLAHDDTERRKNHLELEYRAAHDELTGLGNRSTLMSALRHALNDNIEADRVALMFIDVDRFKVINDSLGHDAGDALLMEIAERLRSTVRAGDVVARLGGDEFMVMLRGPLGRGVVERCASRVQEAMVQPIDLFGQDVFVTVSIGIAFPQEGDRIEDIVRHADAAMYHAKEKGRNRSEVFDTSLRDQVDERLRMESDLRRALPNDELDIFFMPEVDMVDGEVLSVEALLRWHHPELGTLSAAAFVDMAEETGQIIEIGAWVLEHALRTAGEWSADESLPSVRMRVNLSGRQISHPDIVEVTERAIERSGVDPTTLCFEITETALMEDPDHALATLLRLRALGLELAVDDFGTGFSSLSYLKKFPVDVLKIDRSFVTGVADDEQDAAIVASVVNLAEALGLDVVAEGVELERHASTLRSMGVRRGQGYLYGKPQSRRDIEAFLKGHTPVEHLAMAELTSGCGQHFP